MYPHSYTILFGGGPRVKNDQGSEVVQEAGFPRYFLQRLSHLLRREYITQSKHIVPYLSRTMHFSDNNRPRYQPLCPRYPSTARRASITDRNDRSLCHYLPDRFPAHYAPGRLRRARQWHEEAKTYVEPVRSHWEKHECRKYNFSLDAHNRFDETWCRRCKTVF